MNEQPKIKDCCPYCHDPMKWEQWKECWVCGTHGRFGTEEAVGPSPAPVPSTPDPTYQELVDFARWTQTFWKNGIEIMRRNNLMIKTDEPMEKLAFTFYSDLCEIDARAAHLFGEGYGDKNHRDESAIVSQTITAYPKPYEERIRAYAVKQALAPLKAVQEKFSHLDKCLSDPEWCEAGETSAIYGIAGEMWRAIKEATGGKP